MSTSDPSPFPYSLSEPQPARKTERFCPMEQYNLAKCAALSPFDCWRISLKKKDAHRHDRGGGRDVPARCGTLGLAPPTRDSNRCGVDRRNGERAAGAGGGHQALLSQRLDRARQQAAQPVEHGRGSNYRQETVKNSPSKRARRRRCERKQTPQNRVRATKGKSWEKTVEDACLLEKQVLQDVAQGNF